MEDIYVGKYKLFQFLGRGSFGDVRLGVNQESGQEVAVKMVRFESPNKEAVRNLYRETRILCLLNHANIVKLFDFVVTIERRCMVMEYVNGCDLLTYLSHEKKLNENTARHIFRQILTAVDYCHQMNIVHRDLKNENILLDRNLNVKLADFGLSSIVVNTNNVFGCRGSPYYMAPEVFNTVAAYDGCQADVWSLGVILYTVVTGLYPFNGDTVEELKKRTSAGRIIFPDYVSDSCRTIIRSMLMVNPLERATTESLFKTNWMTHNEHGVEIAPSADCSYGRQETVDDSPGSLTLSRLESVGLLHEKTSSSKTNISVHSEELGACGLQPDCPDDGHPSIILKPSSRVKGRFFKKCGDIKQIPERVVSSIRSTIGKRNLSHLGKLFQSVSVYIKSIRSSTQEIDDTGRELNDLLSLDLPVLRRSRPYVLWDNIGMHF